VPPWRKDGIRGFVCVPILARHRILGTLSLGRQDSPPFSDEEVALLECVADQIGLALDNARLYSETRRQLEDLRRSQMEVVRAERLAAVGELAGGVAHEINNPLMIILGQVHLLFQSRDSEEVLSGLKVIDGATKRAASIVRDLVLFAEHFPLHPSRCQVAEELKHVLGAPAGAARGSARRSQDRVRGLAGHLGRCQPAPGGVPASHSERRAGDGRRARPRHAHGARQAERGRRRPGRDRRRRARCPCRRPGADLQPVLHHEAAG
jgi:signal transduction histidine kinase